MDVYIITKKIKKFLKNILPAIILNFLKKTAFFFYAHKKFNHNLAQRYELDHNVQFMGDGDNFKRNLGDYKKIAKEGKGSRTAYEKLSLTGFLGSFEEFRSFYSDMENKNCLEIGSGPYGFLVFLPLIKHRFIIESLAAEYRQAQIKLTGETLFTDNIVVYSQKAEILEDSLVNKIDGCIVCRNMLDHCEDPFKVLENISRYAVSGSKLLLWTDLWHLQGHDEGHRNITKNIEEFRNKITSLGYSIETVLPSKHDKEDVLDYGCVAVKL